MKKLTVKKMKSHMRGALTVDAPRRRLRTWTGLLTWFGSGIVNRLVLHNKAKELVASDHPWQGSLVDNVAQVLVGAALMAFPYTRYAGGLQLGLSLASTVGGGLMYGTEAGKQTMALTGASRARGVRIVSV